MKHMFEGATHFDQHNRPGYRPPGPPRCMSQKKYDECEKEMMAVNEGEEEQEHAFCGISYDKLERQDAVRFPGENKVCYNRNAIKQWIKASPKMKTELKNPTTGEKVENPQEWIRSNLGEGACVDEAVGGRRKKRRSTKKAKSRTKKSRKDKKCKHLLHK